MISQLTEFGKQAIEMRKTLKSMEADDFTKEFDTKGFSARQKKVIKGLDHYLDLHLKEVSKKVLQEFEIDQNVWG